MTSISPHNLHDHRDDRGWEAIVERMRRPALLAAGAGIVLLLIGLFVHGPTRFFQAYFYAWLFWTGISLGCISILLLAHLVGGTWGAVIRRPLESGAAVLPLMALLFIPILFGMDRLYAWTDESWRASHSTMRFKLWWLTENGFILRSIAYFIIWTALVFFINRLADAQDRSGDPAAFRRMQQFAGPGLVIYVATMTLAAFDWGMSLDPAWFSTIYGLLFVVAQALGAIALVIALLALLADRRPLAGVLNLNIFHDLGNLLLAFTMLWAYISFSQYLIIWSADIAEETPYYIARTHTGWKYVALLLVLFHFFVPFLLLLWRKTKRTVRMLAVVACWIAVLRLVDLFWVIVPSFGNGVGGHGGHASTHDANIGHAADGVLSGWWHAWMYPAAAAGIAGVFILAFVWQLKRRSLLPVNDPRLAAAAAGGHH